MGNFKQQVIVGQVGQGGHVLSQPVGQLVQLTDDETAFADVEAHQVFIQLFVEFIGVFALSGNAPVTAFAWLIGEYHSAEGTVEQLVLVELAG